MFRDNLICKQLLYRPVLVPTEHNMSPNWTQIFPPWNTDQNPHQTTSFITFKKCKGVLYMYNLVLDADSKLHMYLVSNTRCIQIFGMLTSWVDLWLFKSTISHTILVILVNDGQILYCYQICLYKHFMNRKSHPFTCIFQILCSNLFVQIHYGVSGGVPVHLKNGQRYGCKETVTAMTGNHTHNHSWCDMYVSWILHNN